MESLFESYPCAAGSEAEAVRDKLVPLYRKLDHIVGKALPFGGFIDAAELPAKFFMSADTYPPLQMSFNQAELAQLAGYSGMSSAALVAQASTPLERLLVAAIWKNGDLQKLRHIADGLGDACGKAMVLDKKSKGPVFKQFGRHLAAPHYQPIADQHTLRAYRMLTGNNPGDRAHLRDTSTGDEIRAYVEWVQGLAGAALSRDRLHAFDKSMFALGSATKYVLSPPHRNKGKRRREIEPLGT